MKCELCGQNEASPFMSKCCRCFMCVDCRERVEKKNMCSCGKPGNSRRIAIENAQVFEIVTNYFAGKPVECGRCETAATVECKECEILCCNQCNLEIHNGLGFSKHTRKTLLKSFLNVEVAKKKELACKIHAQGITASCECGMLLCSICQKCHREVCVKTGKTRPLKEFKEEYFLNVMYKLKQVTFFKEKLMEQKVKYEKHFQKQQELHASCLKTSREQLSYLMRMLEIKMDEVNSKITLYWDQCQEVYRQNIRRIDETLKNYDESSELIQRLASECASTDYLERKIKKYNLPFDYFNLRVQQVEVVQNNLLSLNVQWKQWELGKCASNDGPVEEPRREEMRMLGNVQNAGQQLTEYTQEPLKARELSLTSSHNEMLFNFIHLPFQSVQYEIEYGVGVKIKGHQVFKKILNATGTGIIEGLNSSTKYRVHMRVIGGDWGDITEVNTLDAPKFQLDNCLFAKSCSDNSLLFSKAGTVYGSNEMYFGTYKWVIKVSCKDNSFDDTACMSVGVSNKENKKAVFVGTTLNYGYQKEEVLLRVLLNCEEKKMVIVGPNNTEELFVNLPTFPIFPTLFNKGNTPVLVKYNLTTDDPLTL